MLSFTHSQHHEHFFGASNKELLIRSAIFTNTRFLSKHCTHIVPTWKHKYILFDGFVAELKEMKQEAVISTASIDRFDVHFQEQINSVNKFVVSMTLKISNEIDRIKGEWDDMSINERESVVHYRRIAKRAELSLGELHDQIKQIIAFWKLNKFAMEVIGLKFSGTLEESALPVHYRDAPLKSWTALPSHEAYQHYCSHDSLINALNRRCNELYSSIFAVDESLSESFLEYNGTQDLRSQHTEVLLGAKIGCCIILILLVIAETIALPQLDSRFWSNPGIFVYSAIGSILLFKLCWSLSVWVWILFHVDYISVFEVANKRPNLLAIFNESMTLVTAYFISFYVFLRSNTHTGFVSTSAKHILSPFILIIFVMTFWILKLFRLEPVHQSRGVFSAKVLWNCIVAPTRSVAFRDGFAADALTSFNKIISDSLYGTCWLVVLMFPAPGSGGLSNEFDVSLATCTTTSMTMIVAAGTIIPLWIRFLQCMRQFWDRNVVFPPFLNAIKYALSILVVINSVFGKKTTTFFSGYYAIIVAATLYKWWWDVVMDWGLFWILPIKSKHNEEHSISTVSSHEHMNVPALGLTLCWLRPHLVFEYNFVYYIAIIFDLVLRFIWVLSLEAPRSSFPIPALSIFLGMLEVARRSMWGVLRVEFEFICSCMNKTLKQPQSKTFTYLFENDEKL